MSKLKVNKKIKKFFKKNKLKFVALTMSCSLTMNLAYATANRPVKTKTNQERSSLDQLSDDGLLKIKSNFENNIDDMRVVMNEDNNFYYIKKSKFKIYEKSKK